MAIAIGTNAGFVSSSPSNDPTGSGYSKAGYVFATRDTSPAGSNNVTEMGWWQGQTDNAATPHEVALYSHDATNNRPNVIVYSSKQTGSNTIATSATWNKYAGLSIGIVASTVHWIGVGCGVDSPYNYSDHGNAAGSARNYHNVGDGLLDDPWGSASTTTVDAAYAIYATYQAAAAGLSIPVAMHYKQQGMN